MTLDRSIPVDPLTVLHHADEEVFERQLKMKEEQLDEWPYLDPEDYLKSLEKIAKQYNINVEESE